MVVILPDGSYHDWLTAPGDKAMAFMLPYPVDHLVAVAGRGGLGLFEESD